MYHQNPQNPIRPLSIGNVVSTAIALYRSHLKTYFQLALLASVWFIVPIYGWAKYFAISGMISRLAFKELINQPESVSNASESLKPRLWSFLRIALEVSIFLFLIYLGLVFVGSIAAMMIGGILGLILGAVFNNPVLTGVLFGILIITAIIGFIFVLTWFISRWLIAEVPLSIEEINGKQSIQRSWDLTKASVIRIQGVVMIAFLVTLPMLILTVYAPSIFLVTLEAGSSLYWLVYLISIGLSLVGGAFLLPFWQTTKAVLYYDLRSRREGLDLQLRDRTI
ncbi:hypothetical protein Cri9333_2425 [Crinalium epipsammum PCC 9333]|uniref:Glycerophosphoryl diester phosphodiesterase membrane domain-containing protein n=1 Tax=Crinalium epipsammum PCC 9333 TaxID=1173022 RepID=K9W0L8_9CYAN|nr:hypothetical protein [Crinalium epipsammum]AFZ13292.1 hypothetical protein Cri9333_2425 [Crinalium epipsammum PCC 9333]